MSDPLPAAVAHRPSASAASPLEEALQSAQPDRACAALSGAFAGGCEIAPAASGRSAAAVDRFAQRTLCWSRVDGEVQFAARADAFGARELDPQALFEYLFLHAIPSPRTIFRGVHRVPPAHRVEFDGAAEHVSAYWKPNFRVAREPSFAELKSQFRELLEQAVRAQLRPGIPACFLSGGTDSSTVTGYVKQIAGEVHTYSIGFDAQGYDEMEFARITARHFGAVHHEHYVTPDDLVRDIPLVARAYDQPFGNSSALPAYHCALKARADGVSRLLAGDGGDELFGGNSRYAMQKVYALYGQLPGWLRSGLIEPTLRATASSNLALLRKARNYVRDAKLPLVERVHNYNLLLRLGLDDVLEPAFRAAIRPEQTLRDQLGVWAGAADADAIDQQLAYDWRYTLAESDLPKVRGTSELAGIEVGYPLLDDALLAFSMTLPPSYKVRRFKLRWFFKEALRDFLPPEVITKQKKGFGLPFGVWATRHDALKALASESVRALATRGVVRPAFVERLLGELLPAHPGYYGEMVWILMMLEQWLRGHAPDWRFDG